MSTHWHSHYGIKKGKNLRKWFLLQKKNTEYNVVCRCGSRYLNDKIINDFQMFTKRNSNQADVTLFSTYKLIATEERWRAFKCNQEHESDPLTLLSVAVHVFSKYKFWRVHFQINLWILCYGWLWYRMGFDKVSFSLRSYEIGCISIYKITDIQSHRN